MSTLANVTQTIQQGASNVQQRMGSFLRGDQDINLDEQRPEISDEERESIKDENTLLVVLDYARNLWVEKGLEGSILVSASFLAYSNSVECEVGEVENNNQKQSIDMKALNRVQKLAVGGIDKVLLLLEKRAIAYKNKPYKSDVTLTSGLGVSAPVNGLFSLSVECSATVETLNKHSDAKVVAAKEEAASKAKEAKKAEETVQALDHEGSEMKNNK